MQEAMRHAGHSQTGLSRTCDAAGTCTYPVADGRPVLRCLEYEEASEAGCLSGGNGHRAGRSRLGVTVMRPAVRAEPGLCSTCDLRAGCTFPRSAARGLAL